MKEEPKCWLCGGKMEYIFFVEGAGSYEWNCTEYERHAEAGRKLSERRKATSSLSS